MCKITELIGKTLVNIIVHTEDGVKRRITFCCADGSKYLMHNSEEAGGNDVRTHIEDICGDTSDLLNSPILQAEEVSSVDHENEKEIERYRWTFYKFATIKGNVTIRWYGESNGYYSERAEFENIES